MKLTDGTPAYVSDLVGKQTRTAWSKRANGEKARTKAQLDEDINLSLPREWAAQQPAGRRSEAGVLMEEANLGMDWADRLPAGADGVRLLIVPLLSWGCDIKDNKRTEEAGDWERLAQDVVEVLDVLAARGGEYEPPAPAPGGDSEGKR